MTAPISQATGYDPVRLIETYQAGVWRYLRALGCDAAQAEDLTQDTFLAVLQRPFQDINPAATAAYLRAAAGR
jgi:RNA polymerase sigma-70 factor (ECF subfamily)